MGDYVVEVKIKGKWVPVMMTSMEDVAYGEACLMRAQGFLVRVREITADD